MTDIPVLEVRGLSKVFGGGLARGRGFRALNAIDFQIARAEVLSLVGESGSGKSTVARLVARLIAPTAGEIRLNGSDVLKAEPRSPSLEYRRRVQMIFQDPFGSLSPTHSVADHLIRPMEIHGLARGPAARGRMLELLEQVGLTPALDFAEKLPFEMSGGQRQRVAIARALAVEPELILADEPTSMLDVSVRVGILNLIERMKTERNIAFLYITHDLASARYVGDRILVMYAGQIVEEGESRALMDEPRHPYSQLLLSSVPSPEWPSQLAKSTGPHAATGQRRSEGCAFADRCSLVTAECTDADPDRSAVPGDAGHFVRCFRNQEI